MPETAAIEKAVERATVLGASLTLAGVVPGKQRARFLSIGGPSTEEIERLSIEAERTKLEELVGAYRDRGAKLSACVLVGRPATAIVEAVLKEGFQMVWKAPAQAAMPGDRLLGSLDMRLIRTCPCPISILDARARIESHTVFAAAVEVAPMASDQESNVKLNRHILELAMSALTGEEHKLYVIHAWTLYGESILGSPRFKMSKEELTELQEPERRARLKKVEDLVADFRAGLSPADAARFDPKIHLVKGDPNTALPAAIKALGVDILIMGTASRSGLSGLILGNTAEEILHSVACSVVVAKPEGFISSVEAR